MEIIMFKVRVDIVCPCGKIHSSRTIHSEREKALGTVVCSRCKRRFAYRIIGASVHTEYK